jgi:hypothetical protein
MDAPEILWKTSTNLVLVFVPPHMIGTCLEQHYSSTHASGSSFWINPPISSHFTKDLLPKIHPTLLGCKICGVVLTSIAANGPADIIILEVPRGAVIHDILHATNGEAFVGDDDCILKILPVTSVKFTDDDKEQGHNGFNATTPSRLIQPLIPTCPVCIHRIDPVRLGLPAPTNQQLCSRFCPSPIGNWSGQESCRKQKFLNKWPLPARCKACQVIGDYWDYNRDGEASDLFCEDCSMHKTLWTW